MNTAILEHTDHTESEYYLPYKDSQLFVKFFQPSMLKNDVSTCIFFVHWMDVRGFKGNGIYDKMGVYYTNTMGIPVFIFDILGSGKSTGTFEYPDQQKDQIKTVYDDIIRKLQENYGSSDNFTIVPIVHSISAVAIMSAVNEGLPITRLIWLGGPPSHAKSIKRDIKSQGHATWFMYRFMGLVDRISGKIGLPITRKLFGFRLRLKDMTYNFSRANGARMMLPHTEMDILAIFGSEDEYLELSDIDEEFPEEQSKHVTKVILEGANHSFEKHINELIKIINEFLRKKE